MKKTFYLTTFLILIFSLAHVPTQKKNEPINVNPSIGILTSTPDKVIEPFSEDDMSGLSNYSRYPSIQIIKEVE